MEGTDTLLSLVRKFNSCHDPETGKFCSNTTGPAAVTRLHDKIKKDGGFTFHPASGNASLGGGFAVASFREAEEVHDAKDFRPVHVYRFMKKHREKYQSDDSVHVGAWHNPENDKVYLDLSVVLDDRDQAVALARETGQLSIFDLGTFETIETMTPQERKEWEVEQSRKKESKGVTKRIVGSGPEGGSGGVIRGDHRQEADGGGAGGDGSRGLEKYNTCHDPKTGQFCSGSSGSAFYASLQGPPSSVGFTEPRARTSSPSPVASEGDLRRMKEIGVSSGQIIKAAGVPAGAEVTIIVSRTEPRVSLRSVAIFKPEIPEGEVESYAEASAKRYMSKGKSEGDRLRLVRNALGFLASLERASAHEALAMYGISGSKTLAQELGSRKGTYTKEEVTDDMALDLVRSAARRALIKGGEIRQIREVGRDNTGEIYVKNSSFKIDPMLQGMGIGTKLFAMQVDQARAAGAKYLEADAVGDIRDPAWNGYYTWPRLGYDAKLPIITGNDARRDLGLEESPKRISDLMKTPEGRDWWKQNGRSKIMTFDLDPDSLSSRVLDAYVAKKQSALEKRLEVEQGDLSEDDERILDEVWREISEQEKRASLAKRGSDRIMSLLLKYNDCHDPKDGRFCSGSGGGYSSASMSAGLSGAMKKNGLDPDDRWQRGKGFAAAPPREKIEAIAKEQQEATGKEPSEKILRSYAAFKDHLGQQFEAIKKSGLKVKAWKGEGEPYRASPDKPWVPSSKEMRAKVEETGEFLFFMTEKGFGGGGAEVNASHPLLTESPYKTDDGDPMLWNDVFRVVHDAVGHIDGGFSFSTRGEMNAMISHARTLPRETWPALFAETFAQNAVYEVTRDFASQNVYESRHVGLIDELVKKIEKSSAEEDPDDIETEENIGYGRIRRRPRPVDDGDNKDTEGLAKHNDCHDPKTGKFCSGSGGGAAAATQEAATQGGGSSGRSDSSMSPQDDWENNGVRAAKFKEWFGDWEGDPDDASKVVNEDGTPQETSKVVDENGEPILVFHGTTHEFEEFTTERGNPENDMGRGHYFTSASVDADVNYGEEGPDLTSRIDWRAGEITWDVAAAVREIDQRASEAGIDYEDLQNKGQGALLEIATEVARDRGWPSKTLTEYALSEDSADMDDVEEMARGIAREEIAGESPRVIKAYLNIRNPVVMGNPKFGTSPKRGSKKETQFTFEYQEEDAEGRRPDHPDFDYDTAEIIGVGGSGAELIAKLKDYTWGSDLTHQNLDELASMGHDYESIPAGEMMSRLKMAIEWDGEGNPPAETISIALREMGYDGIIYEDASEHFPNFGYRGSGTPIPKGTKHYIAWESTQIKSADNSGNFDPDDPNIYKAVARYLNELATEDQWHADADSLMSLIEKHNTCHDPKDGRFCSGGSGGNAGGVIAAATAVRQAYSEDGRREKEKSLFTRTPEVRKGAIKYEEGRVRANKHTAGQVKSHNLREIAARVDHSKLSSKFKEAIGKHHLSTMALARATGTLGQDEATREQVEAAARKVMEKYPEAVKIAREAAELESAQNDERLSEWLDYSSPLRRRHIELEKKLQGIREIFREEGVSPSLNHNYMGSGLSRYLSDHEAFPTRQEIETRGYVRVFQDAWARDSQGPVPLALMHAARDAFGLDVPVTTYGPEKAAIKMYKADKEAFQEIARAIYENTQEALKAEGIEEMVLYRGVSLRLGEMTRESREIIEARMSQKPNSLDAYHVTEDELVLNPLSSFSTDGNIAFSFGEPEFFADETQSVSMVIAARVPREKVFSVATTGPGCLTEAEAIVLGHNPEAVVVTVAKGKSLPVDMDDPSLANAELQGIIEAAVPRSVQKYNTCHDPKTGKFCSGSGGGAAVAAAPSKPASGGGKKAGDKKLSPAMKKAKKLITESLDNSLGLSHEQKSHAEMSMSWAFSQMEKSGGNGVNDALESLSEVVFTKDAKDLNATIRAFYGDVISPDMIVGGCYTDHDGTMIVDGDVGGVAATEIYAHELTHAIDKTHNASNQNLWRQVWEEELENGQLTRYGGTSASEGFAEVGRMIFSSPHNRKRMRAEFPKSWAFFRKLGLVGEDQ